MKQTIKRLLAHVIDLAHDIGTEAEGMPDDSGIAGAEAVLHLRDAQRAMNHARDALRRSMANVKQAGETRSHNSRSKGNGQKRNSS